MPLGAGEYITRYALARSIGEAWDSAGEDADMHEILQRILVDHFWSESLPAIWKMSDSNGHSPAPSRNRGEPDPNAGVLLLTQDRDDDGLSIGESSLRSYQSSIRIYLRQ
jgi:taspase (threonine aspartase 1)